MKLKKIDKRDYLDTEFITRWPDYVESANEKDGKVPIYVTDEEVETLRHVVALCHSGNLKVKSISGAWRHDPDTVGRWPIFLILFSDIDPALNAQIDEEPLTAQVLGASWCLSARGVPMLTGRLDGKPYEPGTFLDTEVERLRSCGRWEQAKNLEERNAKFSTAQKGVFIG